ALLAALLSLGPAWIGVRLPGPTAPPGRQDEGKVPPAAPQPAELDGDWVDVPDLLPAAGFVGLEEPRGQPEPPAPAPDPGGEAGGGGRGGGGGAGLGAGGGLRGGGGRWPGVVAAGARGAVVVAAAGRADPGTAGRAVGGAALWRGPAGGEPAGAGAVQLRA